MRDEMTMRHNATLVPGWVTTTWQDLKGWPEQHVMRAFVCRDLAMYDTLQGREDIEESCKQMIFT